MCIEICIMCIYIDIKYRSIYSVVICMHVSIYTQRDWPAVFLTPCTHLGLPHLVSPQTRGGQLLSLVGRIITMDMATRQYIDKCDCFQYVDLLLYVTHLRAGCNIVAGRIRPAGHTLPTLAPEHSDTSCRPSWYTHQYLTWLWGMINFT